MREFLVILVVILLLAGLTAFRYRAQIAAMVRIWRTIKSVREQTNARNTGQIPKEKDDSMPLVNCARCGAWVSQAEAVRIGPGRFLCSSTCLKAAAPTG